MPLKVMGGAFSIPAYAMKGLYQEGLKNKGANVQNYIIAARISQGYDEASAISQSEREDIVSRWKCIKLNVKKKKNVGEDQIEALHTLMKERRAKRQEKWARVNSHFKRPEARPSFPATMHEHGSYEEIPPPANGATELPASTSRSAELHGNPLQHANTFPRPHTAHSSHTMHSTRSQTSLEQQLAAEEEAERREFEAAIQASVSETSRGNPEEDDMIARAIRASITELERPVAHEEDDEEVLQRALKASIDEASKHGASEEEQKLLEETLKNSVLDKGGKRRRGSDSEWDSSDTEDDEEYQRIIAESKELAHLHSHYLDEYAAQTAAGVQETGVVGSQDANETGGAGGEDAALKKALEESEKAGLNGDEDVALKKALEESEKAEQERMVELEKQKTEEDIVLEYVKKQSLAEEEHRRRMMQGRDIVGESSSAGGSSVQ